MIATDNDWRFDLAALHQFIHSHAKFGARAKPEPTNPRRQTLEMDSLLGKFDPPRQSLVLRKKFESQPVGPRDVRRIPTQRNPSKWPFPFTEQRPDVFGNKAGNIKRVFHSRFFRLRPEVVPVIESDRAHFLQ